MRRTKIIATIGPASDGEAMIKDLAEAGADVFRINLSHGSLELAMERFRHVRHVEETLRRPLGILVDLPGPKVRAGAMPEGGLPLVVGGPIRLVPGEGPSTSEVIQVNHDGLLTDLHIGDRVTFGDGNVVAEIFDHDSDALVARVSHGGLLQGRPGVHIPSDRLRLSTPTDDDIRLLDAFVEVGVDMVALSFVRSAHDVRRVGTEPHPRGPLIVAKIETRAAVHNLDGIIDASGAVMIARGDLGSEFPIEELPHLQKQILSQCITMGRPAITATQMLESMVSAPTPTRAEASDIANAVFDGSSAVMLSGETAMGHDPVRAVATMARIAERADEEFDYAGWQSTVKKIQGSLQRTVEDVVTNSMTDAARRAAAAADATAIICVTRTGFTARSIARYRPGAKILGLSSDPRTVHQLTMSWGVTPYQLDGVVTPNNLVTRAIEVAKDSGEVRAGDLVVVLSGSPDYKAGQATDSLRLAVI